MFEFERYVHNVFNPELLQAYLSRVGLRVEILKAYYGIS